MHHAPAVSFPLGRSRFLAALLLILWCVGAAVIALWSIQQAHWRWPQSLGVLAVLAGGWVALRWWRGQREGVLEWDGARWQACFEGSSMKGSVTVHLDLQRHLWLKLHCNATASDHWLWLERDADPWAWADLRRAVYSRASADSAADTPAV